jgi:hypothetical protein
MATHGKSQLSVIENHPVSPENLSIVETSCWILPTDRENHRIVSQTQDLHIRSNRPEAALAQVARCLACGIMNAVRSRQLKMQNHRNSIHLRFF